VTNPPLRSLQISTAATSLGKWAFAVTLSVYAFREGGAAAIGLVALIQAAPATLAAPLLGLAGDRFPRQRVLLVTNVLRALLLAVIAAATIEGLAVSVVFVLAALFSTVSTANQPARAALIPVLARSPGEVSSATAVMGSIDTSSFLLGAGGGGVVLAATSVSFVIALCCLAYVVAAVLILEIPVDARPAPRRSEPPLHALAAGFQTVLHDAHLRLVVMVMAALSVVDGLMNVLVIVTAIRLLHIGTAGIGYLNIARGAGGLIGGTAAFALLGRSRLTVALALGTLALGAPLVLLGVLPHVVLGVAAWGAFGLGYVLVKVSGLTLVQRLSGDRVLARVLAVVETTFVATIGLGAILAPALVSLIGLRGALIATGAALPALTAIRWMALRRLEIGVPVPVREFELLRRCPVFAPLPLATAEGLARRLVPLEVPAGAEVITQGDPGDRFYLIADGEVEIIENGVFRRRQGPGESFGEIALLHDIARTATVRAIEATRLLTLDRDPFLISVTGHADSHDAAVDVAERFLGADGAPA
jgi:Cyclic nucleotide-binding domain/Major Facilitator Superfamily